MTIKTDSGKCGLTGRTYQQFIQKYPLRMNGIIYSDTSDSISFYCDGMGWSSLLEAKDALLEIVEWIIQVENGELA